MGKTAWIGRLLYDELLQLGFYISEASVSRLVLRLRPSGVTILVNEKSRQTPITLVQYPGQQVRLEVPSQWVINAGERRVFSRLSMNGGLAQTITVPAGTLTLNARCQVQFNLTLDVSGSGTATTLPAAADGFHPTHTTLAVTATPSSGHQFSDWNGHATGTRTPATVLMNGTKQEMAAFQAIGSGGKPALLVNGAMPVLLAGGVSPLLSSAEASIGSVIP